MDTILYTSGLQYTRLYYTALMLHTVVIMLYYILISFRPLIFHNILEKHIIFGSCIMIYYIV